jgi:hypothetical protein
LPYHLLGINYFEMGRAYYAAAQIAIVLKSTSPEVLDKVVSRLPYRDDEPKRWSLKRRQRDLTLVLHRLVEVAPQKRTSTHTETHPFLNHR